MSFDHSRRSKKKSSVRRQVYGRKQSPRSLRAVAPAKRLGQRETEARRPIGSRRLSKPQPVELLPLVTVVMAVRNEGQFIERSLAAQIGNNHGQAARAINRPHQICFGVVQLHVLKHGTLRVSRKAIGRDADERAPCHYMASV